MNEEEFQELARKRIVYNVPGMEEVPVRRDLVFKRVEGLELKLDLYTPRDQEPGARRPAIIFVSGSGATADTMRLRGINLYVSYGQLAAASGFVGITFDHRGLEGFTKFREVGEDADDLVEFMRANAGEFGVDPERICIWTFSAGSIYGLRTALRNAPAYVRCVVTYYGVLSLFTNKEVTYTPEQVASLRPFSAAEYLRDAPASIPPLFVARAGQDRPLVNDALDEFVQVAIQQNVPLTLMNHPSGVHTFEIYNDDGRSREIMRATLEFIKTHL